MADLDVSDVLDDPDFNSTFQLIRSTSSVDATGVNNVVAAGPVSMIGVVQPAGARDIQRLADLSRTTGAISIWARFRFLTDAPGVEADLIVWDGSTYAVMTCDPWLYGSGYFKALASLETLS